MVATTVRLSAPNNCSQVIRSNRGRVLTLLYRRIITYIYACTLFIVVGVIPVDVTLAESYAVRRAATTPRRNIFARFLS